MDKISITVNGKTFKAEGKDLFEIIDNFLNDATEEQYTDIPKEYDNYEEYLCLDDFNPAKCTTKEQIVDLQKKLDNRIDWIKNNPKVDLEYVRHNLSNKKVNICDLINRVDNIKKAYELLIKYINQIHLVK